MSLVRHGLKVQRDWSMQAFDFSSLCSHTVYPTLLLLFYSDPQQTPALLCPPSFLHAVL